MACCLLICGTIALILAIKVRLLGRSGARNTQTLAWRLSKEDENDPA